MNELKRLVSSITYQLYANALLRCVLLAVSAYLLTAAFSGPGIWPLLTGVAGFVLGAARSKLYQDKKPEAIRLIHQTVGDVEYSLPLLTKTQLNLAEQLQLDRLNTHIQTVRAPLVVLAKAGPYSLFLIAALAIHIGYPLLKNDAQNNPGKKGLLATIASDNKPVAPTFESASLRIQPPAYTRLPEINSANLNASSVVGAILTWTVQFSASSQLAVRLVSSQGKELTFRKTGSVYTYQDKLVNAGLYAIKAYWHTAQQKDSVVYQSDFYRLEARPDLAPKIEPNSKELYSFHTIKDPKTLTIGARISDDFLVSKTFLVATVARGSGENVKFREVRLPLSQANFKDAKLTKTLDLNELKFTPGDELYYYWAAFDNRQPEPNFTKSDTYFLVYKDTTEVEESELATMAVNIMPEYFRSQRQIIIDTEKLIASRKKTTATTSHAFKSQSNEIGFDQKALRLRYGQFLGEEFEKSIGGGNPIPTNNDGVVVAGMAAIQAYVHKHDQEEGEQTPTQAPAQTHSADDGHNHGGGKTDDKDPMAALMEQYVHSHDDAETNTFHEQSTRSLLKMALENMWQSELHLRLYEPEKALPFEQEALKYLKMSQQKARSYVRKSGFDPPQTKEKETRLTGEMKNVTTAFNQERTYSQQRIERLVAEALGYLDMPKLTIQQRQLVQQLGNALANGVVNSGMQNWSMLTSLQKLAGGKALTPTEKAQLKTKLYSLAGASERTGPAYTSDRALQQAFWRHIN